MDVFSERYVMFAFLTSINSCIMQQIYLPASAWLSTGSLDSVSIRGSSRQHRRTLTLPCIGVPLPPHPRLHFQPLIHLMASADSNATHSCCLHQLNLSHHILASCYREYCLIVLSHIITSLTSLCILTTPLPQLTGLCFHPRIHLAASADGNATPSPCKRRITSPSTPPDSISFRGSSRWHRRTSTAFSSWISNIYLNAPHTGLLLSWVPPIPHHLLPYRTLYHHINMDFIPIYV